MSVEKHFAVYIMASRRNGTLYIGVTSNFAKRIWEHKHGFVDGFTRDYGVSKLVWLELHDNAESAITREKQLKKWNRAWKVRLIEETNPYWNDLYSTLTG
jgi:putative endonuclease